MLRPAPMGSPSQPGPAGLSMSSAQPPITTLHGLVGIKKSDPIRITLRFGTRTISRAPGPTVRADPSANTKFPRTFDRASRPTGASYSHAEPANADGAPCGTSEDRRGWARAANPAAVAIAASTPIPIVMRIMARQYNNLSCARPV